MKTSTDAALALLRTGAGAACFFVRGTPAGLRTAMLLCAALVIAGVLARSASALLACAWTVVLARALQGAAAWYLLPVLATLFVILFTAVALAGPGRFAVDRWLSRRDLQT